MAEDYKGAEAVLKQIEAQSRDASDSPQKPNPVRQWRADLKSYKDRADTLTPDEAAQAWIALFDRAIKLPALPEQQIYGGLAFSGPLEAFQALPPPPDWDALAAQAAARPLPGKGSGDFATPVLRIITGTLQNKPGVGARMI